MVGRRGGEQACTVIKCESSGSSTNGGGVGSEPEDAYGKPVPSPAHPPPADEEAAPERAPAAALRVGWQKSTLPPLAAFQRGLSARFDALEARRPGLYVRLALAALTCINTIGLAAQVIGPGWVDPSLTQLLFQFQPLGIALVQSLLLRHKLQWPIWPTALVMVSGRHRQAKGCAARRP